MWKAVGLQVIAALLGTVIAGLVGGIASAGFFLLGATCATVPNALFALRLWLHKGKSVESYPVVFFLGEFIKIGLTIAAIGLIVKTYQGRPDELLWLPLILGLIVALKAPLAMWWFDRGKQTQAVVGAKATCPAVNPNN